MKIDLKAEPRNDSLADRWSIVHFLTSFFIAYTVGPVPAFVITTLWEPLEILVIAPIVARWGILFGHETIRNSLSDIVFNSLGIGTAIIIIALTH